jgi:methylmalonyl-CoA/ethylmalonyl-CoA epimerase
MSNLRSPEKRRVGECLQIGLVVSDLNRTIDILSGVFGIGPFRTAEWPPAEQPDLARSYRGQPGRFTARMAWADLGTVELEVIQPLDGDSAWADFLRRHGDGVHHIKFNVDEVEPFVALAAAHGLELSQRGEGLRPGTEWAYVDVERQVGFHLELFNALPGTDGRTPPIVEGKVES